MTKLFKLKYVKRIDLFYIAVRDEVRDAEGLDPDFNLSEIKSGEGGDEVRDGVVIGF